MTTDYFNYLIYFGAGMAYVCISICLYRWVWNDDILDRGKNK